MAEIHLIDAEDLKTKTRHKDDKKDYISDHKGRNDDKSIKKKKEKPVRIVRVKYYEKITLTFMENSKIKQKDIFAINRGLEKLFKDLYYNINRQEIPPPDCIFVEKDSRMVNNDKFIYIDINREEMIILKKNLEDPTTVYAFNKGEFSILEGKMSFLKETWGVPGMFIGRNKK